MGNICALDMGIIVLRISIFDRHNDLFPCDIQKKLEKRNQMNLVSKDGPSQQKVEPYFMSDLSFYSKEHGGTFHFLQFNVLYRKMFVHSLEFKYFLKFIEKTYPQFKRENSEKEWSDFITKLEFRKQIIDLSKSNKLNQSCIKKNMNLMPVLSTGGYNDTFLKFVANIFNTRIVKCREYMRFVIKAIDYLNRQTNDCFFSFDRKSINVINQTGELSPEQKPIQQFFSLKQDLYPYLLVNLRSGSMFTRVDSETEYRRIAGSPIGSNVFLGILRLLNIFNDPTDAINAAIVGDSGNFDMTVGDIYGGSYDKLGLPSQMIASSFGKIQHMDPQLANQKLNEQNGKCGISRSLLTMVSVNTLMISQMLTQLENIKQVVWIGVHIDILEYMQMSQYAFQMLTMGKSNLLFPTYHSFLGSLGILLSLKDLKENQQESDQELEDEKLQFQSEIDLSVDNIQSTTEDNFSETYNFDDDFANKQIQCNDLKANKFNSQIYNIPPQHQLDKNNENQSKKNEKQLNDQNNE